MELSIGTTIANKRRERKITQQELADFVGVSKASVSKWGTGQTYPNITLLPMLAAYFDISIDVLLNHEAQLSSEEIRRIYASLKQLFEQKSGEEVLMATRSLIRQYYSCYPFLLQMGLLLMNHYDLFPGNSKEEKLKLYVEEARMLFIRVEELAREAKLVRQAIECEAYALLVNQHSEEVLALLGEYIPKDMPTGLLIAGAFQQKGDNERAIGTLQRLLFNELATIMNVFSNYLQLLVGEEERFKETYQKAMDIAKIFHLDQLHPVILLNVQLSGAIGFAQLGEKEAVIRCLEDFLELFFKMSFPIELHGDVYFDRIQDWLDQLDIGSQLPRNEHQLKEDLVSFVLKHPLFTSFSEDPRMKKIFQQLKEGETHEHYHG